MFGAIVDLAGKQMHIPIEAARLRSHEGAYDNTIDD